jgi:UDP-glucuronate 4-epimerase
MKVLVTGAAGFIGFHTALKLLDRGDEVIGFDNLNPYYDPQLKRARLNQLLAHPKFRFTEGDLGNREAVDRLFASARPQRVVHLAAQAGVRHSIHNPHVYAESNLTGFLHVLEGCRSLNAEHLVFASSSSVYGANTSLPFSLNQPVDHPISLYAATKKANELMAHAYSHLYSLPVTGLRFFTVYGPWGRPDMAPFLFTKAILEEKPIKVFNHGRMRRDFTYIDDIVEAVIRAMDQAAAPDPAWDPRRPSAATSSAPYRLYNIGNNSSVLLTDFIFTLEEALGKKALKEFLPMQNGDVPETYADVSDLARDIGFKPATPLKEGVRKFVSWYKEFYGHSS